MTATNQPSAATARWPPPDGGQKTSRDVCGTVQVLVVDADCALIDLLDAWLGALGCGIVHVPGPELREERFDLVIVDVPHPRQGGIDLLRRLAAMHPTTPIIALSSAFFAKTECCGAVARALGVACVCPKPVSRDALTRAVRRLLPELP